MLLFLQIKNNCGLAKKDIQLELKFFPKKERGCFDNETFDYRLAGV